MTTSITDSRFTHLHATDNYILAQLLDEPPENGWSVMPGFDEDVEFASYLEPPRLDTDETLPSQIHPSYPYGRRKPAGKQKMAKYGAGSEDTWDELDLAAVDPGEGREVPPVMAGSKRPPSPTSPALRPHHIPPPRSMHLRHLLERQRQETPPAPPDPFDAPVPNETYTEDDMDNPNGHTSAEHQHQEANQEAQRESPA